MYYASGFAVIALAAAALRMIVGPGSFERRLIDSLAAMGVYFLGGVTGGVIVGMLRRWLSSWIGAMVVGALATIPASFGLGVFMFGVSNWTTAKAVFCVVFGIGWGSIMSVVLWSSRSM